ncbi:hypothetical protein [Paludisphaera borealis]|uniref:Uncharacterized protein n=1 Tax=Paludisphaera borealis TaxID=1387353 RepID=A0A1U7CU83_9BACT|nr:hypothetical protein [Paludisphaera borealis]APW62491.1 hypothetical protein BSF38_04037 [Paludisphaera borealis]
MLQSYNGREMESWTRQTAFPGTGRIVLVQGAATALIVLLVAAMTWAAWLSADSTRPDEGGATYEYPGAGMIVRSETLHLWLPDTLGELASPQVQREVMRDFEGFRRFLEHRGQQRIRIAVTYRAYQVNGGWTDITLVRRPYDELSYFQELSAILAGAGGEPDHNAADRLGALVQLVPEELLSREPSAMGAGMRRIVD